MTSKTTVTTTNNDGGDSLSSKFDHTTDSDVRSIDPSPHLPDTIDDAEEARLRAADEEDSSDSDNDGADQSEILALRRSAKARLRDLVDSVSIPPGGPRQRLEFVKSMLDLDERLQTVTMARSIAKKFVTAGFEKARDPKYYETALEYVVALEGGKSTGRGQFVRDVWAFFYTDAYRGAPAREQLYEAKQKLETEVQANKLPARHVKWYAGMLERFAFNERRTWKFIQENYTYATLIGACFFLAIWPWFWGIGILAGWSVYRIYKVYDGIRAGTQLMKNIIYCLVAICSLFILLGLYRLVKGRPPEPQWRQEGKIGRAYKDRQAKKRALSDREKDVSGFGWNGYTIAAMSALVLSSIGVIVLPFMGFVDAGKYAAAGKNLSHSAKSAGTLMDSVGALCKGFFSREQQGRVNDVHFITAQGSMGRVIYYSSEPITCNKNWVKVCQQKDPTTGRAIWMVTEAWPAGQMEIWCHQQALGALLSGQLVRKEPEDLVRLFWDDKKMEPNAKPTTLASDKTPDVWPEEEIWGGISTTTVKELLGSLQDKQSKLAEDEAMASGVARTPLAQRKHDSWTCTNKSCMECNVFERGQRDQYFMSLVDKIVDERSKGKEKSEKKETYDAFTEAVAPQEFGWGSSTTSPTVTIHGSTQGSAEIGWNYGAMDEKPADFKAEAGLDDRTTKEKAKARIQQEYIAAKDQMVQLGVAFRERCCGVKNYFWEGIPGKLRLGLLVFILIGFCIAMTLVVQLIRKRKNKGFKAEADFTLKYDDGTDVPDSIIAGSLLRVKPTPESEAKSYNIFTNLTGALRNYAWSAGQHRGQLTRRDGTRVVVRDVVLDVARDIEGRGRYRPESEWRKKYEQKGNEIYRRIKRHWQNAKPENAKDLCVHGPDCPVAPLKNTSCVESCHANCHGTHCHHTEKCILEIQKIDSPTVGVPVHVPSMPIEIMKHEDTFAIVPRVEEGEVEQVPVWVQEAWVAVEQSQRYDRSMRAKLPDGHTKNAVTVKRYKNALHCPAHAIQGCEERGVKSMDLWSPGGGSFTLLRPDGGWWKMWTKVKHMVDTAAMPAPLEAESWPAIPNPVCAQPGSTFRGIIFMRNPDTGRCMSSHSEVVCTPEGTLLYKFSGHTDGHCGSTIAYDNQTFTSIGTHILGDVNSDNCKGAAYTPKGMAELEALSAMSAISRKGLN